MTAPAFTSLGKEVLRDGQHYADAVDPTAAAVIAAALSDHPAFYTLRSAAHAYFHASTDRTLRVAAGDLREALAIHPTQIGGAA